MKTLTKMASLFFLMIAFILSTSCASAYVNSKSRGEIAEERRATAVRNLEEGVPPEARNIEEPSIAEGISNDPVGHAIAVAVDLLAGYLIYDNVRDDSEGSSDTQRASNESNQDLALEINGDSNSVTVSSTTTSTDTDSINNNSNNDNRSF